MREVLCSGSSLKKNKIYNVHLIDIFVVALSEVLYTVCPTLFTTTPLHKCTFTQDPIGMFFQALP